MTKIEMIMAIDAAAQAVAHGGSAAVGTFRQSSTQAEVDSRVAEASAALESAEHGLRLLAKFLRPSAEEFRAAGLISEDGCWGGAGIW